MGASKGGPFYEDTYVQTELCFTSDSSSSTHRTCCFDLFVTNRSGSTLQQVWLERLEGNAHGAYELRIQAQSRTPVSLRSRQRLCFKGVLEVLSPFDSSP